MTTNGQFLPPHQKNALHGEIKLKKHVYKLYQFNRVDTELKKK